MKVVDFMFDLPKGLIAEAPLTERRSSRLMVVDPEAGSLEHKRFVDVLDYLSSGDVLVLNNTRVIPARLKGKKASGGAVEALIERVTGDQTALAHVRASKSPKPGAELMMEGHVPVTVTGREGSLFCLQFDAERTVIEWLETYGHMPLPPYIERSDTSEDRERYQTVYSDDTCKGAVAAPTAGLHFDADFLAAVQAKGVEVHYVTLHVGAGTFQPVRVDSVEDHDMHSEWCSVPESVCDAINACHERGGRVIAVGTTSVRSLESAAEASSVSEGGSLAAFSGETSIFLYPGKAFQVVDAVITNFHLPGSTLIMLVSAFVGRKTALTAYEQAISDRYRFYSYGDAMLLNSRVAPEVAYDV